MVRSPLADGFLASLGSEVAVDPQAREELEEALTTILAEARRAWGDLAVADDVFVRYVAERIGRGPRAVDPIAPLRGIHATDLFLACACANQDARAMVIFEKQFLVRAERVLHRLRMAPWAIDETKQVLRCRFFLPRDGSEGASIEDYSGHGALQSWVSAAAVHASYRVAKTPRAETTADSVVMKAVSAPGDDLELGYLKRHYAEEFEAALKDAFARLSPRERNILRGYHLESAGIDGVAAMYRVHRVTAWRWVKAITAKLHDSARAILRERTHANREELSSMLRLLQSRIDTILRNVLGGAVDPARPSS